MKILLLCHEYPPLGGGGGIGASQYAEAWSEKGHVVTVITSWRPGLQFTERVNGAEIIRVLTSPGKNRATFPFAAMLLYLVFGLLHIARQVTRYRRYDVINTHFSLPDGLLGMAASRLLGLPNVLTIIGGDIYDPTKKSSPHKNAVTRRLNSRVMNSASRIIAISSDTKRNAQRYYNVRNEINIVNYGFPMPGLKSQETPKTILGSAKYHLVAVGRLVERKGFEYLIQAMTRLPEDIVLHLIGDGPLRDRLRSLADEYNINGRLRMTGYLTREQINGYLQSADCFVLSSIHEGLGIVVQEAMQAGLPIVSTNNGGQVDILQDHRNGILVSPQEPDALAGAIRLLYTNNDLAQAIRLNNREDIKQYHMPLNAERYIQIFEAVARGKLPTRRPVEKPGSKSNWRIKLGGGQRENFRH